MTPLHAIGDSVRGVLLTIPLGEARMLFLAIPLLLLGWVLALPAKETMPAGDDARPWDNLKIWASLALIIQIIIYAVF